MEEIKDIYPCDKEWYDAVYSVLENGGSLWIVERTDTNQFLINDINLGTGRDHDLPPMFRKPKWRDSIPTLNDGFLYFNTQDFYPSRELAERFAPKHITEGGCEHCGNGAIEIPTIISEHQFIKQ